MRRGCDQRVALHSLQLLLQGLRIPPVIRGSSVQAVRLWLRLLVVLYRNWRKQQACHWVVRVDVTRRRRPAHFCWRAGPAAPSKAEWRGHQHHRHGFVVDRLDHAIGLRREEGEEGIKSVKANIRFFFVPRSPCHSRHMPPKKNGRPSARKNQRHEPT